MAVVDDKATLARLAGWQDPSEAARLADADREKIIQAKIAGITPEPNPPTISEDEKNRLIKMGLWSEPLPPPAPSVPVAPVVDQSLGDQLAAIVTPPPPEPAPPPSLTTTFSDWYLGGTSPFRKKPVGQV